MRLNIFTRLIAGLERGKLVDLGAGHCKFSQLAHEAGFEVTSIDARLERVPADVPWQVIRQDVRDVDLRRYSIVCILGLLYHLTLDDQCALLAKCAGKTVIVDTHCSPRQSASERGYEGHLFPERLEAPTAAWGNKWSFWHTEASLRRLFMEHGFEARKIEPEHDPGRAFWFLEPVPVAG